MMRNVFYVSVLSGLIFLTTGCWGMTLGGKSAGEAFPDSKAAALVKAGCAGKLETIDALVKEGADVNYASSVGGITPLIWVQACHNLVGIEKLLKLGANPNQSMESGDSPVWLAAGDTGSAILGLMLRHGGDPNISSGKETALVTAAMNGRLENVKLLLQYGADMNRDDGFENTAATKAAAQGNFDIVVFLLEQGYQRNLLRLARFVEIRQVPTDSEWYRWKLKAMKMLEDRGIKFPLPPVVPKF